MADDGRRKAERQLRKIDRELHAIYTGANKAALNTANRYFSQFAKEDEEKRKLLKAGKITEKEYQAWRMGKMMSGKKWTQFKNDIAYEMHEANKQAQDYIYEQMPQVYADSYNYIGKDIKKTFKDYVFTGLTILTVKKLVSKKDASSPYKVKSVSESKDIRWNTRNTNSEIIQAIFNGESIPKIAKRIQRITGMNESAATRNARTISTGVENRARLDSLYDAKEKGIHAKKVWLATHDDRTRDSHMAIDGESVEIDELFSNGLEYPGDPDGEPAEVYNCRCTLIYELL